jgi:hypothetical protein
MYKKIKKIFNKSLMFKLKLVNNLNSIYQSYNKILITIKDNKIDLNKLKDKIADLINKLKD